MLATQNATPQDHWPDIQQNHTCAVAEAIGRVYVAKQHERASRLDGETCQRESRGIKRVEELCRVDMGCVFSDLVDAHEDGLLSRKGVEDQLVDMIDCIVLWREDGTLEEELIRLIALVYIGINVIDESLDGILRETHVVEELYSAIRR